MKRYAMQVAAGAACLLVLSGTEACSKPFQVVVPSGFHGTVVINCSSVGTPSKPIAINEEGAGQGTCPPFESSIEVLRDGRHAHMQKAPMWDTALDGNTSTIRFVVQP